MIATSPFGVNFILYITLAFLLYKLFTRNFGYWKKRGIYHRKPTVFFGNSYKTLTFKTTFQEYIKEIWDETDEPYFGIFIFNEPVLVLKSPELIKDVLIKDFSIFSNRRVATPTHPTMAYSLFFLKYKPWKKVRTRLSPLFTSGMLKNMFVHIKQINELLIEYITKNKIMDGRLIGGHFATEMIIRCFYSANPHCFDKETSLFSQHIDTLFDFNLKNAFVQNAYFIKPSLVKLFKLNFIETGAMKFFEGAFKAALSSRETFNGKPQNFVDLTNKAIREEEKTTNGLELQIAISNAIFVLLAGQETTNNLMAFTLYELAINQHIQDKLREEIKKNVQQYGEITYEGIHDNKYLEMCINETTRKYTAIPFLDRMPISDYHFKGTDLTIKKGLSVIIPFYALHRDEKYYPNAETYNPDRFAGDELNTNGLNFIPFGEGPRACIGKRLGIMALAMGLSSILLKFKVEKCDGTPEKIEFNPKSFALVSKVGLPLKFVPNDTE